MATKHAIDLVFLVDATGSMGEVIDGLKASIRDFFAYLTDEGRNDLSISDWRAKVVGYRDITADEEWIVNNPFVTTREELEAQLDALEAKGGGDPPEDLLDALLVVADMEEPAERGGEADGFQWRHHRGTARGVVVFTDASYHPKCVLPFHNGATWEDVARRIAERRVILEIVTPVKPHATPDMQEVDAETFTRMYDDLATARFGEYLPLCDEQGNEMPFQSIPRHMGLFRKFMGQLAASISASAAADPVPEM
ncbi:MAG: VWA domain-containing protein [Kiritimatiellae bacterium]|nr:VWA domain-containing protein [Kiritimatiellia bacterium]